MSHTQVFRIPWENNFKNRLRLENDGRMAVYLTDLSMIWMSLNEHDDQNFSTWGWGWGWGVRITILRAVASPETHLAQKGGWQREEKSLQEGPFYTMVVDFGESTRGLKIRGHRDPLPGSESGQSLGTKLASLGSSPHLWAAALHCPTPWLVPHHVSLCSTPVGFDPTPLSYSPLYL